jgi:hypothetical protein
VFRPVAYQHATELLNPANEIDALHETASSSTLRMPGI